MNTQLIQSQYGLQGVPAPVAAPTRPAAKRANMKKRVRAAQGKAKFVGFLYLLGAIALLAAACLPLLEVKADGKVSDTPWQLSVLTFWQPFTKIDFKNINLGLFQTLTIPGIYGILLFVLFVNVIRCFAKLKWLYKKKASRTYGFNRNAFAMEDMGRIFSDSFCAVALATFAIFLLGAKYLSLSYIVAAAAVVIHLFCGVIGGTVSLFTARAGVEEEKRRYGSFGPIVRNIVQLAATAAFAWFFAKRTTMMATLLSLTKLGGYQALFEDLPRLIAVSLEIVTFLCWIVLLKHATGVSEFDRDGREAAGRKNFAVFAFFAFLLMAGVVVVEYMMSQIQFKDNLPAIYVAAIAFGAFLLDVCLCWLPRLKKAYRPAKEVVVETDPTQYYTQQQPASRVPLQCISSPCFVNQGGQQYMVMPMTANPQDAYNNAPAVEYYFVD